MRKNIFEQLKEKISFSSEIKRLDTLIKDKNGIRVEIPKKYSINEYDIEFCSLENFVNIFSFKCWKGRGTCISCKDMRESLYLDDILFSDEPTFDETINYCEYVANILKLPENAKLKDNASFYLTDVIVAIRDNLKSIMDWLNLEMSYFKNEEIALITEKNAAVSAVAECVDEELAYQIVKYNHYTLKGDISKKKEILLKLGNELEPKRKQLSSLNGQLEKNLFFILNNLNIRHNNSDKEDKDYKEYTAKMKENELEEWYDELYQMSLLAMLELEQVERNQKINELKTHYENKKKLSDS